MGDDEQQEERVLLVNISPETVRISSISPSVDVAGFGESCEARLVGDYVLQLFILAEDLSRVLERFVLCQNAFACVSRCEC